MRLMTVSQLLLSVISKLKNTVSFRFEVPLPLRSKRQSTLGRIDPLTLKISLVILVTVCLTTVMMLVLRIWYWINWWFPHSYFPLSSSLFCLVLYWYCKLQASRRTILRTTQTPRDKESTCADSWYSMLPIYFLWQMPCQKGLKLITDFLRVL